MTSPSISSGINPWALFASENTIENIEKNLSGASGIAYQYHLNAVSGESFFTGTETGVRIVFTNPIQNANYIPLIQACENGQGYVGEISISNISKDGFTVVNSGEAKTKFRWYAVLTKIRQNMPVIAQPFVSSPSEDNLTVEFETASNGYVIQLTPFEANDETITKTKIELAVSYTYGFLESTFLSIESTLEDSVIITKAQLQTLLGTTYNEPGFIDGKLYLRGRYKAIDAYDAALTSQWSELRIIIPNLSNGG